MQERLLVSFIHPLQIDKPRALHFYDANGLERLPLAAERGRRRGLVGQDVLDLLHDLWSDLGEQGHGLAVVLDLGNLGGAKDNGADIGVHHAPGQTSVCE
jgi:hypothetical protein